MTTHGASKGNQVLQPFKRFGYISDAYKHMRTPFMRCAAAAAVTTPPSASNKAHAPPVMDQGQTGSCTGHGTAGAICTTFAAAGNPLPWVPSQAGIYTVGRCIDRNPEADGSLPPLMDEGAMPNQVMRGITEWGVRPSKAPAADGRNSDCSPETINDEPSLDELELADRLKLIGEYEITSTGGQRISDIRKAIAAGMGVGIGLFADEAFMAYDGRTILGAPDMQDPNGGGHWVYLIGYRTDPNGRTIFLLRNSWGTGWGLAGDAEVSEAFIQALFQIIVLSVKVSA